MVKLIDLILRETKLFKSCKLYSEICQAVICLKYGSNIAECPHLNVADVNGPLSPNLSCTSPAQFINSQAALNGNNKITIASTPPDPNILKWFSSDVLKNHMPTMPPLPTQGQKVLTLDDLEGT